MRQWADDEGDMTTLELDGTVGHIHRKAGADCKVVRLAKADLPACVRVLGGKVLQFLQFY